MALFFAVPTMAHQQKIAISTISHNPLTNLLEVVHRVPLHDAEHALKSRGAKASDIVTDIETRRMFARYVGDRFSISREVGAVDLLLLGSEIEGGYIYIYQEAASPGPGEELLIFSGIMTDIWSRQESRVNIGLGPNVDTLIFQPGDQPKTATLP
ncbi:DUF6702 family protein [Parasphingorhabdus sp.]|uniref:DUF6702 family protein n=1 Tax=Parasphingorhabdus sp. TaxID=2709688 RepID=UPI0032644F8D